MKPVVIGQDPMQCYWRGFHILNMHHMAGNWFAASVIGSRLLDGRAVVLLGERVNLAFGGRKDINPLIWYKPFRTGFRPACVALVPATGDPWYDDADQAGAARNFMELLAEGDYPDWSDE